MRKVLVRAINKNQLLLLKEIAASHETISSLVRRLSREKGTSVSALKANAKVLKELGVIEYGNSSSARLTGFGRFVLKIIGGEKDG